jgi:hypothetical protein
VLRIKPKTLYMLSKLSTTKLHSQPNTGFLYKTYCLLLGVVTHLQF